MTELSFLFVYDQGNSPGFMSFARVIANLLSSRLSIDPLIHLPHTFLGANTENKPL